MTLPQVQPDDTETPFASLTPQAVLDALDAVDLVGDGRMIQLNSYENRVFQVFLETGAVVVPKFYRPGRWSDAQILEEHRFAAELAAHEIPVIGPLTLQLAQPPRQPATLSGNPPTLAHSLGQRFSVSPRRSGRAPELEDPRTLEWIGRFIGRLHAVGAAGSFAHRWALDVDTFGRGPRDFLLARCWVPPDALPRWRAAIDGALAEVQRAFERLSNLRTLRLHGDCHPGNVLWTEQGPHFVDLDDCMTGPAVQDLWMLLSGRPEEMRAQLDDIVEGYQEFADFDQHETALIEPLRTLRIMHYAGWLARRWDDPAFPRAFPWFQEPKYWEQHVLNLREQVAAMEEPFS